MSTERTFAEMSDAQEQYSLCRELCHDLAKDLQKEGMKGKTVTLKIKNVSFEVKTRAFTLQCALGSEEEIFAVAKDLLKAEIDNVSPQPLRLRLMGVRVSGFINAEDKQPQQKSIMGFLKVAPDSTQSSEAEEKSEMASSSSSSVDPKSKDSLVVKGMLKPFNWVANSGGSTEPQQQTFFQKAYAKRLQKQSDQEQNNVLTSEHHGGSILTAKSGFIGTMELENVQSHSLIKHLQIDETRTKYNTESPNINTVLYPTESLNGRPGAQTHSDVLQCFTCPVCFNQIKTTDLAAFNQHIDECLGSPSLFGDPDQRGCKDDKGMDKQDEVEKALPGSDHHTHSGSSSMLTVNKNLYTQTLTLAETNSCENANSVFKNKEEMCFGVPDKARDDVGCIALPQTADYDEPIGSTHSTLTCPVCNQVQDTHNLIEFNHHVDMCLNRDVLSELREDIPQRTDAKLPGKVKADPVRSSNGKGKSKRRTSSPLPAPKKTKAANTRLTIDTFFKGNCHQKF